MKDIFAKIAALDTGVKVALLVGSLALLGLMMMAGVSEIDLNE